MEFQFRASDLELPRCAPPSLGVSNSTFPAGNLSLAPIVGELTEEQGILIDKMEQEMMMEIDSALARFESKLPLLLQTFSGGPSPSCGLLPLQLPEPQPPIKKKERLIFLPRPGQNVAGVKRKSPPEPDVPALPYTGSKKSREELKEEDSGEGTKAPESNEGGINFRCELCKVFTFCAKTMKSHLNGKKHNALLNKTGGNLSIATMLASTSPIAVAYPSDLLTSASAECEDVSGREDGEMV